MISKTKAQFKWWITWRWKIKWEYITWNEKRREKKIMNKVAINENENVNINGFTIL